MAAEKGMRLMNPIWMDGTPALPTPRGPVSLTIVLSGGEQEPVTLAGPKVAAWLEGRLSDVDHQLDQALNVLKARRPL